MHIYTDGSVTETGDSGAAYVIPALKIQESYYLGKGVSIFACELVAILMALTKILDLKLNIFQIVVCVDLMSVLDALQTCRSSSTERPELTFEIKHLIHSLFITGSKISFCWLPSHCGFWFNECADRAAKQEDKKY